MTEKLITKVCNPIWILRRTTSSKATHEHLQIITCMNIKVRDFSDVNKSWTEQVHPSPLLTWKIKKKLQKGEQGGKFGLIRGVLRLIYSFSWSNKGMLRLFLVGWDYTPSTYLILWLQYCSKSKHLRLVFYIRSGR